MIASTKSAIDSFLVALSSASNIAIESAAWATAPAAKSLMSNVNVKS